MSRRRFLAIFEGRLFEFGLSGLVLGFALYVFAVRTAQPFAVSQYQLAAFVLGFLLANVGGALVGLRFAQPRIGQRLVLGASGALVGTIIIGSYLSTAGGFNTGPPVVVAGLGVAVFIGIVVALVEWEIESE